MNDEALQLRRPFFELLFVLAIVIGIGFRVFEIDNRPLHSDEGVNFNFLEETARQGYYPYSHENYHGPLYFYLTIAVVKIVNAIGVTPKDSELALRGSAILAGFGLLLLPLLLRKREGNTVTVITALLMVLSSSLIFHSRYAIHEMLFGFGGTLLALSVFFWLTTKARWPIYVGALALAILITTKETFIITLACVGGAGLVIVSPREVFKKFKTDWSDISLALAIIAVLIAITFTGGFQWAGGLREMFLAVPQWVGRNESDYGHHKPFLYYANVLLETEPQVYLPFILLALMALCFWRELKVEWRKGRLDYPLFTFVWGSLSLLVYSYVKYKTPWLVINITIPLTLCSGWLLAELVSPRRGIPVVGVAILLLVLAVSAYTAKRYVFEFPFGARNPYSYVHTSQGMMDFVNELKVYERNLGREPRVTIAADAYWPLPYYFRGRTQVGYQEINNPDELAAQQDILVIDHRKVWDAPPGWVSKYYRLSDVSECHAYFKVKTTD